MHSNSNFMKLGSSSGGFSGFGIGIKSPVSSSFGVGGSSSRGNGNFSNSGMGSNGFGGGSGMILTAEEIKDVVCCTGLWLVVREGFGGVGKEKRKGDGWRIRG